MTPAEFAARTNVSRETLGRLRDYVDLLRQWNQRINLVSAASLSQVWHRHLLDCVQLLPYIPQDTKLDGNPLVDLGSGAGLPGLILAILGAQQVVLVESDQRKCAFLAEAARITGVSVLIRAGRAEELPPLHARAVTARALAPLPRLLPWVHRHLAADGTALLLKGARLDEELTALSGRWTMDIVRQPSATDASGVLLVVKHLAPQLPVPHNRVTATSTPPPAAPTPAAPAFAIGRTPVS